MYGTLAAGCAQAGAKTKENAKAAQSAEALVKRPFRDNG
jgi:hypothetical protein